MSAHSSCRYCGRSAVAAGHQQVLRTLSSYSRPSAGIEAAVAAGHQQVLRALSSCSRPSAGTVFRSLSSCSRPSAGIVGAQQLQQAHSRYCERSAIAAGPQQVLRALSSCSRPSAGIVSAQQLQQALSRYCGRSAVALVLSRYLGRSAVAAGIRQVLRALISCSKHSGIRGAQQLQQDILRALSSIKQVLFRCTKFLASTTVV